MVHDHTFWGKDWVAVFKVKVTTEVQNFSEILSRHFFELLIAKHHAPEHCNCLLMGIPNSVIQPLQKIQNFAARLVLLAPRHHHSIPLLEKLHWLPI